MSFAIPADHRMKIKESEKIDEYFDVARELKKLWNMLVTVITIVIGAFGEFSKFLEKRLRELKINEKIKTTQTIWLRLTWIPRWVKDNWADLLSH